MKSHKYVKRTGSSGNYKYWYRGKGGKLHLGAKPSRRKDSDDKPFLAEVESKIADLEADNRQVNEDIRAVSRDEDDRAYDRVMALRSELRENNKKIKDMKEQARRLRIEEREEMETAHAEMKKRVKAGRDPLTGERSETKGKITKKGDTQVDETGREVELNDKGTWVYKKGTAAGMRVHPDDVAEQFGKILRRKLTDAQIADIQEGSKEPDDFLDTNMVMAAALKKFGIKTGAELGHDHPEAEAAAKLWNETVDSLRRNQFGLMEDEPLSGKEKRNAEAAAKWKRQSGVKKSSELLIGSMGSVLMKGGRE